MINTATKSEYISIPKNISHKSGKTKSLPVTKLLSTKMKLYNQVSIFSKNNSQIFRSAFNPLFSNLVSGRHS